MITYFFGAVSPLPTWVYSWGTCTHTPSLHAPAWRTCWLLTSTTIYSAIFRVFFFAVATSPANWDRGFLRQSVNTIEICMYCTQGDSLAIQYCTDDKNIQFQLGTVTCINNHMIGCTGCLFQLVFPVLLVLLSREWYSANSSRCSTQPGRGDTHEGVYNRIFRDL